MMLLAGQAARPSNMQGGELARTSFKSRNRPDPEDTRRAAPLLLFFVVVGFALLFWVIVVWAIPGLSLAEIHRSWGQPGFAGFSLFAASTFIVLLLVYPLILESVLQRRAGNSLGVALAILSFLPLAAIGGFLVELASMPGATWRLGSPDDLSEPFDGRRVYLGRILSQTEQGHTRYLQVVLEDGSKVVVADVPRYDRHPEADHVVVRQLSGRHTHTLCYRLESRMPSDWLGLRTELMLDRLE